MVMEVITEAEVISNFPTFRNWVARQSFFNLAAWYCLIAPFITAGLALIILNTEGPYDRFHPLPFPNQDQVVDLTLWACLSSVVFGLAGLFGIRRHGLGVILWKVLPGIIASCLFGFAAFVLVLGRIGRQ
jgi:hypothetical protein